MKEIYYPHIFSYIINEYSFTWHFIINNDIKVSDMQFHLTVKRKNIINQFQKMILQIHITHIK